jgi:shikimate dehydrogenase
MTKYFGSFASTPGKTGKYYYSRFFQYYNIDAEYNPIKAENISELLEYFKTNKYSGLNISMPFKQQVVKFLQVSTRTVDFYDSCNTIKVIDGELNGFNTDINGVLNIVSSLLKNDHVIVLGNGSMGKTFAKVLTKQEFNYSVVSPSLNNWEKRHTKCDVLINCTSLGTSSNISPVNYVNTSRVVYDLAINGSKLREMCKSVTYVPGLSFYKEVFLEQFFIQTDIWPDEDYFDYLTKLIV